MKPNRKVLCTMQRYSRQKGFTLMELMITVGIIGVLIGIAYPSYTEYMYKSRRSEARTVLMQLVAKQEQFFQDNRRYSNNFTEIGNVTARSVTAANVITENGYYTITINRPTLYTYTLTAAPTAGTSQSNDQCKTLTIDQDGTKDFTPLTAKNCW